MQNTRVQVLVACFGFIIFLIFVEVNLTSEIGSKMKLYLRKDAPILCTVEAWIGLQQGCMFLKTWMDWAAASWVGIFWSPFQFYSFKWKEANVAPIYRQYRWNIGKLSKYRRNIDNKWRKKKWQNQMVDISILYMCQAVPILDISPKYWRYIVIISSLAISSCIEFNN